MGAYNCKGEAGNEVVLPVRIVVSDSNGRVNFLTLTCTCYPFPIWVLLGLNLIYMK